MYDDARLAAALATGLVENDTFRVIKTATVTRNVTIRNCTFHSYGEGPLLDIPNGDVEMTMTGCMFHEEPVDEMIPLYDLLEESNGRVEA